MLSFEQLVHQNIILEAICCTSEPAVTHFCGVMSQNYNFPTASWTICITVWKNDSVNHPAFHHKFHVDLKCQEQHFDAYVSLPVQVLVVFLVLLNINLHNPLLGIL